MLPVAKAVSGVAAVSTSLEKIHRWPAATRRSSWRFRRSTGTSAAAVSAGGCSVSTSSSWVIGSRVAAGARARDGRV